MVGNGWKHCRDSLEISRKKRRRKYKKEMKWLPISRWAHCDMASNRQTHGLEQDCMWNAQIQTSIVAVSIWQLIRLPGQQIRSKIESFQNAFLFLNQTLWCDHSLESSRRDDFNEGHIIRFCWEMRKLSWKPFCSLFLNCSPGWCFCMPWFINGQHHAKSRAQDKVRKIIS